MWYGMISCDMVWYDITSYGLIWYIMIWYDIILHHMISYHIIWYQTISYMSFKLYVSPLHILNQVTVTMLYILSVSYLFCTCSIDQSTLIIFVGVVHSFVNTTHGVTTPTNKVRVLSQLRHCACILLNKICSFSEILELFPHWEDDYCGFHVYALFDVVIKYFCVYRGLYLEYLVYLMVHYSLCHMRS